MDDDSDDDREVVLDVWSCNIDAVSIFQLCPVEGIGHMGGIHWTGITPCAIRSACHLLHQARSTWPRVVRDVELMGNCVAAERNRQAHAKSRSSAK